MNELMIGLHKMKEFVVKLSHCRTFKEDSALWNCGLN
jgi:hypothetical protein